MREEIFAKSEFEIFSREEIFANILFTRKYLPAKISSRENVFPRKFLLAKISSRELFPCPKYVGYVPDLRRIRRHIPLSTAKTISNALISSRLDYCNSLLNNIAKQDVSKLQRVQNCLARVVLRAPRFSPSLPLRKQLHWLPVNYRIKFKLSTLAYRALAIHQPHYLASLLHFSNIPRQLRSSTSQQLSIPRTKLNLGKRAFSVATPIVWNELPLEPH